MPTPRHQVTLASPDWEAILTHFEQHPEQLAVCRMVQLPRADGQEYVVEDTAYHTFADLPPIFDTDPRLVAGCSSARLVRGGPSALRADALLLRTVRSLTTEVHLAVSFDDRPATSGDTPRDPVPANLAAAGLVLRGRTVESLDLVRIRGRGMGDVPLVGQRLAADVLRPDPDGPWSRFAGALGGWGVWRRLVALHIAVIGVGRTGSLVADELAASGVQHLTLLDPDIMESHNVDAMALVTAADVGRPKVEALRDRLVARFPHLHCRAVAQPLHEWSAWATAADADLVVTCPDENAPRLLAGELCRRLHRPLLDIGSAIRDRGGVREAGADVRLILPRQGCLWCVGGVVDPDEAVRRLLATAQGAEPAGGPWRARRLGSLRSLNQTAVGLGMRLVEDLVAGRLRDSVWYRLTFTPEGAASLEVRPLERRRQCEFCRSPHPAPQPTPHR